ncbi:hypothetical protein ACFV0G_26935, partial [Kitasatospora sp. NPDC059571]
MTATTTTAHDDWSALRTTALLGTDRRPLPGPAGPGPARAAAEAVDRTDPATALLDLAALAVVRRRAGLRPDPAPALPAPAPADGRPALPEAAAGRLGFLLGGRGPDTSIANLAELLPQWLATARAYGYRLPPALVPALLDTARGGPGRRAPPGGRGGGGGGARGGGGPPPPGRAPAPPPPP